MEPWDNSVDLDPPVGLGIYMRLARVENIQELTYLAAELCGSKAQSLRAMHLSTHTQHTQADGTGHETRREFKHERSLAHSPSLDDYSLLALTRTPSTPFLRILRLMMMPTIYGDQP